MNSKDNLMQVENPQLVGREQIAVYVPVDEILDSMADDPDERFKGNPGDQGPQGLQGVGITSISVGTNDNIVIQLSNGNTYDVHLPFVKGSTGEPGPKGDPFSVSIIYSSIEEMEDAAATDGIPDGAFALIDTGNVEDEDNAKVFVKQGSTYSYVTDMSGASGIQGPAGISITSVSIDSDSHLKVTLSNGSTIDAGEIEAGGGGTKIIVGGVEVSEWNADTKLDKVTSTAGLRGDRVYAISNTGNQKTIYAEEATNGNTIPFRDANGQLRVKETPTADYHAASKKYVDSKVTGGSLVVRDITESVSFDTTASVPTLKLPYNAINPGIGNDKYGMQSAKLIINDINGNFISIDVPYGYFVYEGTVWVNDPGASDTGTVKLLEDTMNNVFTVTDIEGSFISDLKNQMDSPNSYVSFYIQYFA